MNSTGIVYPYLATLIGKPFLVSIFLFCSLPSKSKCHKFFELSLATTITVLTPVSCDHVTSFNYNDKKARDVDLTCWCHLSNIILFCFVCLFVFFFLYFFVVCIFCQVIFLFPSGLKRWTHFYRYNISGCGEILNYNGLRQMGLIHLQWHFVWCVVLTRDVAFLFNKSA